MLHNKAKKNYLNTSERWHNWKKMKLKKFKIKKQEKIKKVSVFFMIKIAREGFEPPTFGL